MAVLAPERHRQATIPPPGQLWITVPMPPNISNGSHGHWASRHKAKRDYWEMLDMLVLFKKVPPAPDTPLNRAWLSSTMHLGAEMDLDNAMRRHKWVADWLVTRGYVANDDPKTLIWTGFPKQIIKRDGRYRLELVLDALQPSPC